MRISWEWLGKQLLELGKPPDPKSPVERFVKPAMNAYDTLHEFAALSCEVLPPVPDKEET